MFVLGTVYVYLLLQDGKTALMRASKTGHTECVEALLQGGAYVDTKDDAEKKEFSLQVRCLLLMYVTRECDE